MTQNGLNDPKVNLTEFMEGFQEIELEADSRLNDEDLIHIGNMEFKVIHTPRTYKRRKFTLFSK